MQAALVCKRYFRERGDVVSHTLGVGEGRRDDGDSVTICGSAHGCDVDLEGDGVDGHLDELYAEVVARLVKGRVCRRGLD